MKLHMLVHIVFHSLSLQLYIFTQVPHERIRQNSTELSLKEDYYACTRKQGEQKCSNKSTEIHVIPHTATL